MRTFEEELTVQTPYQFAAALAASLQATYQPEQLAALIP